MKKSWKTTLGGALSSTGKTLMGIGIVPQLSQGPSHVLTYIAVAGFVLDAVGGFFGHLFAADQSTVIQAIEDSGGDTTLLRKK